MSQAIRTGNEENESFNKFFECWLVQEDQNLQELVYVSTTNINSTQDEHEERVMRPLIDRVVRHYENYYEAKSSWVKHHVLATLSPSWLSTLEDAFRWIGGWRPTMAIKFVVSKSELQFKARLAVFHRGLSTIDHGELYWNQIIQVGELQAKTTREEKQMSEKVSELMSSNEVSQDRVGEEEDRVKCTVLASKEVELEELLHMADDVRLRTIKEVIEILNPTQGVHFLIGVAELHLRLHDWGKRDAQCSG